jgi:hypothetical protein
MKRINLLFSLLIIIGCNDGSSIEDEILVPREVLLSSKWKSTIYSYNGKIYDEMLITDRH